MFVIDNTLHLWFFSFEVVLDKLLLGHLLACELGEEKLLLCVVLVIDHLGVGFVEVVFEILGVVCCVFEVYEGG